MDHGTGSQDSQDRGGEWMGGTWGLPGGWPCSLPVFHSFVHSACVHFPTCTKFQFQPQSYEVNPTFAKARTCTGLYTFLFFSRNH